MTSLPARLALAAASGLVAALAFEPFAVAYLLPLAVAGATLAVAGVRPRNGFLLGLVFGVTFMGLLLPWLRVIHPLAWPALAVLEALFYGLGGWATSVVLRLRFWPVWVAAVWVTVEWLRGSIPFGGFPWGRLGFAAVDTPLLPLAAYLGVAGVTFLVALIGTTLAWLVRDGRTRPVRGVVVLVAMALAAVAASALPLPGAPGPEEDPATVTVAAVQGDVPGVGLDAFSERRAVLDNHVNATLDLAARVDAGDAPRTRPGRLAGELLRHRPVRRPDRSGRRGRSRPSGGGAAADGHRRGRPGRRRLVQPRHRVVAAGRAGGVLRQAAAGAVR